MNYRVLAAAGLALGAAAPALAQYDGFAEEESAAVPGYKCVAVYPCPAVRLRTPDGNFYGCNVVEDACAGYCRICTGAATTVRVCVPSPADNCEPAGGGAGQNCGSVAIELMPCTSIGSDPAPPPNGCFCGGGPTGLPVTLCVMHPCKL